MKKILVPFIVLAVVSIAFIKVDNPLRNTKWEGETGLVVQFMASDTVKMLIEGKVLATAQYKVKDSLLTWRDMLTSNATCDTSIRGTYIYRIKENVLTFRIVSDRCEDRADVLQTLVLIKAE